MLTWKSPVLPKNMKLILDTFSICERLRFCSSVGGRVTTANALCASESKSIYGENVTWCHDNICQKVNKWPCMEWGICLWVTNTAMYSVSVTKIASLWCIFQVIIATWTQIIRERRVDCIWNLMRPLPESIKRPQGKKNRLNEHLAI